MKRDILGILLAYGPVVASLTIYYYSKLISIYYNIEVLLKYLPSYSSNLNLIEILFSILKT